MDEPAFFGWLFSSLLLSLRIAPALAFAPPFSLIRVPATFRLLFAIAIAGSLAGAYPEATRVDDLTVIGLFAVALRELFLGIVVTMVLQIPFAALQLAGRTIDIQAGFGLAMVVDPSTQAQNPLTGTLFLYAAGIVFFGLNGHLDLMRILGASVETIPLGQGGIIPSLNRLTTFIGIAFLSGLGMGGLVILSIFLTDMTVAMLSRTLPQMNVLVLGFQIKTIVLLTMLPVSLGFSAAILTRLVSYTLQTLPLMLV